MSRKKKNQNENKDNIEIAKEIKQDKSLIIGVIAILIVFGAIIYALMKTNKHSTEIVKPEIKEYNGFIFEKIGDYWQTNIEVTLLGETRKFNVLFHYTPDEVEYIPTEKNIRNDTITPYLFLNVDKIYITTDPDYPGGVVLGGVELAKVMANVYYKQVKSGLTKSSKNTQIPIVTCENITENQRVIYLKLGNETKIYFDNGCVIVQGKNVEDVLKASERLTFEMLKIL